MFCKLDFSGRFPVTILKSMIRRQWWTRLLISPSRPFRSMSKQSQYPLSQRMFDAVHLTTVVTRRSPSFPLADLDSVQVALFSSLGLPHRCHLPRRGPDNPLPLRSVLDSNARIQGFTPPCETHTLKLAIPLFTSSWNTCKTPSRPLTE